MNQDTERSILERDIALREAILAGGSDWDRAYSRLIEDEYSMVVLRSASKWFVERDVAFSEVFIHLRRTVPGARKGDGGPWHNLKRWDPSRKPFRIWFTTVVENLFRSYARKRNSQNVTGMPRRQREAMPEPIPIDTLHSALAAEERPDERQELVGALEQLDPTCREILIWKYVYEYDWSDIAPALEGKPTENTAAQRGRTCREKLSKILEDLS